MGKGSKSGGCKSASHQVFKDRAKNRVEDLQVIFTDLQSARKDNRTVDVTVLEEQVHQMLREWKSELNEPSPASSLQGGSLDSFSSDICRLLQIYEEQDDATSALAAPKPEPDAQKAFCGTEVPSDQNFHLGVQCKGSPSVDNNMVVNDVGLEFSFGLNQEFEQNFISEFHNPIPTDLPPSAFLGPKCSLWDCPRPVQGWGQDYCSSYHAALAMHEGPPGMAPVLRPGGIGLKDNLLFAALTAKAQGKDVGIPQCEGAATAKSPWNAPELFDLLVLKGETLREWLFFDKPRRAFESGNRKQRSLPDYNGRGWHESRKQVMNEFGGLKRSYYMDPQPMKNLEWHLYEYEMNKCDAFALYRLELKLVEGKKSPKGKICNDSVSDLQKQMGRLSAEFQGDAKRGLKGRAKSKSAANTSEGVEYEMGFPCDYLVDNLNGYYLT